MRVVEMFTSIQGEGAFIGYPAFFIRVAGCNLQCPWCDSKYTWIEGRQMSVEELAEKYSESEAGMIVITGGEPMLQQRSILKLLREVDKVDCPETTVIVETNGTQKISDDLKNFLSDSWIPIYYEVSPKPIVEWEVYEKSLPDYLDEALYEIKIPIGSQKDVEFAELLQDKFEIEHITVMPMGTTPKEIQEGLRKLWTIAIAHGWKLLTRLHIEAFGNKRGI